jgi:AraC-like DNA-binding protein
LKTNHYIPAQPRFKQAIQSIWQVEGFPSFHTERIIPKGVVEVIFNFSRSDRIPVQLGDQQYCLSHCFINGFNTAPIQTQLPEKQVFFGVEFQPMAVKKIFKTPAGKFSNTTVDLTLLDSGFHSLWHELAEQDHFDKRVAVFLRWLTAKSINAEPREQLINDFLYDSHKYDLSVKTLANELCYSTRQLSRKLSEATGMNTEEILLYKKYLHSVELMHQSALSLTEIAYQSNFSDQSHFIKTFKAYTHITPGNYQRNMSYVKGHLYGNVR